MYRLTQTAVVSSNSRTARIFTKKTTVAVMLIQIIATAIVLVATVMLRSSLQATSVGPKRGCVNSHDSIFGELFVKQGSARMKKIVLGMTGKNAPRIPRPQSPSPDIK